MDVLLTLRVAAIPEVVFLAISGTEDVVTEQVHGQDEPGVDWTKLNLVEDEVTRLERVDERNPCEITDGEHEPEPVGCDVHCGEYCRL